VREQPTSQGYSKGFAYNTNNQAQMAQNGAQEVRYALGRLMELIQSSNTPDKRAKLEEGARDFASAVKACRARLEGLPGAHMDASQQEAELAKLRLLEKQADEMLGRISESYRSSA
jgi:hypothetical protein